MAPPPGRHVPGARHDAMTLPGPFRLSTPAARQNALAAVAVAPEGYWVWIEEETRNGEQNDKFHALLTDISGSRSHGTARSSRC